MDKQNETSVPRQDGYVPRPRWQVWAARAGLVIFILIVIAQLLQIAAMGK